MSIRTEEIARTFHAWLERYSPPMSMKDKPKVVQEEADHLLRVVLKFAPREGYNGWIDEMLDHRMILCKDDPLWTPSIATIPYQEVNAP